MGFLDAPSGQECNFYPSQIGSQDEMGCGSAETRNFCVTRRCVAPNTVSTTPNGLIAAATGTRSAGRTCPDSALQGVRVRALPTIPYASGTRRCEFGLFHPALRC
jgi:hypothetical protein